MALKLATIASLPFQQMDELLNNLEEKTGKIRIFLCLRFGFCMSHMSEPSVIS